MTGPVRRDHGGGLDAAVARFGGRRADWIDLSTGINPVAYPVPALPAETWSVLPDRDAEIGLVRAARAFWTVPEGATLLAAPGVSALIARIPALVQRGTVDIPGPTYNEHAAAFRAAGWQIGRGGAARVVVNPNNPDGRRWTAAEATADDPALLVIDESFADAALEAGLSGLATRPGTLILKSFGKFWGLAGLRLGFAIGDPGLIARLTESLGPWPVSGPALAIGTAALGDIGWAETARARLGADAARLDAMMRSAGAVLAGGTPLFRLFEVDDATQWQVRLAQGRVWSRVFPYSSRWLRLGLPAPDRWDQLDRAL